MLIRPKKVKINASPGFLLLVGILIYLNDEMSFLWIIASALFHELGHVAACLIFGGRVEALTFNAVGAELQFSYAAALNYTKENLVCLAGPIVNLVMGTAALCAGLYLPALSNLGLGIFNLLPISPMDGGRIIQNVLIEQLGIEPAVRISAIISGLLIGLLVGFALIAAVQYANFTLLMVSLWLLIVTLKKKKDFL